MQLIGTVVTYLQKNVEYGIEDKRVYTAFLCKSSSTDSLSLILILIYQSFILIK